MTAEDAGPGVGSIPHLANPLLVHLGHLRLDVVEGGLDRVHGGLDVRAPGVESGGRSLNLVELIRSHRLERDAKLDPRVQH